MKFLTISFTLFIVSLMFHSLYAQTYNKSKFETNPEIATSLDESYESGKYTERNFQHTGINWQNPVTLDLTEPVHFPYQTPNDRYLEAVPISLSNGQILMVWPDWDILNCAHSTDGGLTWGTPIEIISGGVQLFYISGIQTSSNRVITVWRDHSSGLWLSYSDDNGNNWSTPVSVTNDGSDRRTNITQSLDGKLWLFYDRDDPTTGRDIFFRTSTNDGLNWSSEQTFAATSFNESFGTVVSGTGSSLLAFYVDDSNGSQDIFMTSSNDGGSTWSTSVPIINSGNNEYWPRVLRQTNGDLWMIYIMDNPTPILPGHNQSDIYYTQSFDGGNNWTTPTQFTQYVGYDSWNNADLFNNQPLVTFCSWRWAPNIGLRQVWYGLIGTTLDSNPPPAIFDGKPLYLTGNIPIDFQAFVDDENAVSDVQMFYTLNGTPFGPVQMFDDGAHNDESPLDNIWGASIGSFQYGDVISYSFSVTDVTANTINVEAGSSDIPPIHDIGNITLNFRPNAQIADMAFTSGSNAYWPHVNGDDYLYQGGLWIGWDGLGDQRVMNLHYYDRDWQQTPGSEITLAPGISDQDGNVTYDDQSANSPQIGLRVHQESYQWSDPVKDDFIIFRYTITNTGENGNLNDLYTTLWSDPDIGDAFDDLGGYDAQRGLIYLHSQNAPNGYIGFKILDPNSTPHTAMIERPPLNSDFDRFNYMTSGFPTLPTDPRDYDMLLTAQPINLSVGSSRIVAFGIVMGGSLQEIQDNADQMDEVYNNLFVGGGTYLVTNTDDSGPGSLRYAIDMANYDGIASLIEFDPGLIGNPIMPESELPGLVDDNTTIDGDIDDDGLPDIIITSEDWRDFNGLVIQSAYNNIRGLVINYFNNPDVVRWAMMIRGGNAHHNKVAGCYIGTSMNGNYYRPNRDGISISEGAHDNIIGGFTPADRNLISGNDRLALMIRDNSNNNLIKGNYIGTNISGMNRLSNNSGIVILNGAGNNVVGGSNPAERNLISGHYNEGIYLGGENTNNNIIAGNYIGTDISGNLDIGNQWGIYIQNGPRDNIIGGTNPDEGNIIAYNNTGIVIEGGEFETSGNRITQNSITRNGEKGIRLDNNGNNGIGAPNISEFDGSFLRGWAEPNSTVEIFADEMEEGAQYLGSVQTNNEGNFEFGGPFPEGNFYNATVTDGSGNTSEFAFARILLPVNQTEINVNRWRVQLPNDGSYSYDKMRLQGNGAGGEFPKNSGIFLIYAAGQYLGSLKDGSPSVSQFDHVGNDYVSGKIINESPAPIEQLHIGDLFSEQNRVFVIDSSRSGYDWDNWPVEYGAPVDANGDPLLLSKQDSWTVYNDLLTPLHTGSGNPVLGVEIQRSTYSYTFPGAPSDVFFVKWKIINKSNNDYPNTYFGAWFDPDVDDAYNDLVGTDTTLNMAYFYNPDASDAPEAFSALLIKGPIADGEPLGLTATATYINGQDLENDDERYNMLQGLDRWGNEKPYGPYDFTGDPLTNLGNLDWNPADKRLILCSGPFTLYAGNVQEVVVACIGAIGTDRLDAVANLKETTKLVQEFYERPTITISKTKGIKKFKTPVRISVSNVEGLLGADLKIHYDNSILELEENDVKLTPLTNDFTYSVNVTQNQGIVSVALAGSSPLDSESSGILVKLPFKVQNGASIGDYSDLILNEAELTFQSDSLTTAATVIINGGLEVVEEELFGDVNQSGDYDLVDVVLILKAVVEMYDEFTPFQELLADANKNGKLAVNDALKILDELVLNKHLGKSDKIFASIPDTTVDVNLRLPVIQGDIGQEVIVPVRTDDSGQLLGLDVEFLYDHSAIILESIQQAQSNDLLAGNLQNSGYAHIAVINREGISNEDGDLVNLVFQIIKEGEHTLTIIKSEGVKIGESTGETIPNTYALYQNYPNPFNPTTTIKYDVPEVANVLLKVYNILGEEVVTLVNEEKTGGRYQVDFNAGNLSSGVYVYTIKANDFVESKKLILLK